MGVAAGAVAAGAVAAGAVAAGASVVEPSVAGAGAARAELRAREPKFVSEVMKPLASVDLLELSGADLLDVARADPMLTPTVAAPRIEARLREGAI